MRYIAQNNFTNPVTGQPVSRGVSLELTSAQVNLCIGAGAILAQCPDCLKEMENLVYGNPNTNEMFIEP
jgi:hypothetical protein